MAITRKFPKEDLQELIWGSVEGYELLKKEMYDTSRWSIWYEMIFTFDGKFYQTTYSIGATESQDERPYEYDGPEIECIEVKPVEQTVVAYIPVEE